MTAAILFAREVIENFFGQDTGIKQNMVKIESHPTVTICPFLDQCDGPMELILRLQGEPKDIKNLSIYEGIYNTMSSDLINDKPYWTHKQERNKALWYNTEKELWIIGPMEYIGSNIGYFNFNGTVEVPYEASGWYYWNNGYWNFTTSDVVLELG